MNQAAVMSEEKPFILVVDDDDRLRVLLKKYLSDQGFVVSTANDAQQAKRKLEWFAYDLMVLDVMMPGETGFELLESYRQLPVPVLMLSAMGEAEDRIKGLEIGADDYLTKPFEPKELVLRIRSILKRQTKPAAPEQIIQFGEYQFDLNNHQLRSGRELIALTSTEAMLLKLLASQPGKPMARDAMLAQMPSGLNERTIDVQITRLRKKIEGEGKPRHLQTIRGSGYVLYTD